MKDRDHKSKGIRSKKVVETLAMLEDKKRLSWGQLANKYKQNKSTIRSRVVYYRRKQAGLPPRYYKSPSYKAKVGRP